MQKSFNKKHAFFLTLPIVLIVLFSVPHTAAESLQTVTISYPGPHNLSYLPIDLIPKIGADLAQGVKIRLDHVGGGAVALQNLVQRNSDFAVAGVPAMMSLYRSGNKILVLVPIDDAPLFILMVRAELRNKVKSISDLKGRVIGVNTSSVTSKTTSQQLTELLLKSRGVELPTVRIIPAGQSWEEQSSLIISATADAIMGDEPFASRLLAENRVFFLANLTDPEISQSLPGAGFLHAALATRPDVIERQPQKAEKMVGILRQTLQWMANHTPEQIVEALDIQSEAERSSLIGTLKKYRNLYSRDGLFSSGQLRETEVFFHKTCEEDPLAQQLSIESMIYDKWAGSKD